LAKKKNGGFEIGADGRLIIKDDDEDDEGSDNDQDVKMKRVMGYV
jgi:hypothetical protein